MRCSIIRRVSTEEQAKKISLTEQLTACQAAIQARGWFLVRDFNFAHTHGADLIAHPLYRDLIAHIVAHECDVLITYVLDRTLRDTAFWASLSALLQKHGVRIATPTAVYDPQNLEQELFLNISSAIGHFERKKIRERAIMGLNGLKDAGGWTGGTPPYGYFYDPADKAATLKIDPTESEKLREIFRLARECSKIELCARVNALGYRSRLAELWTPRMIRRLLERPRLRFYAGLRLDSHDQEIPATWPALISRAEYIALLDAKKQRTTTTNTRPAHLLTGLGIFRCGYCGLSVKISYNKTRKNPVKYYYCTGYQRGRDFCEASKATPAAAINEIVIQDIIRRVTDIESIRAGIAATQTHAQQGREEATLRQRRADLESKRERLVAAVENGLLNYQEVSQRLKPLRDEISLLDHKLAEIRHEKTQKLDPEKVFSLAQEIGHLPEYDLPTQRRIVALLVEKITLHQKSITIEYRLPIFPDGRNEIRHPFR